jgi:hypothetical protein
VKYIVVLSILFLSGWCSKIKDGNNSSPLARVGESYLYKSDLEGLIKPGLSKDDSVSIVNGLTEKWIRKQLILEKAVMNLTEEEKDVDKELDEYRTSLIIYKYEQKLIKEKLDTLVTNGEVTKYYNENPQNFVLNNSIVKVLYIKLPADAPKIQELKEWMKVENEENVKKIDEYCYQQAIKYDYFDDKWVSLDNIKMLFPFSNELNDQFVMANKIYEAADSLYHYLLSVRELQLKGTAAPYSYVEDDIRNIVILKRKQKLIYDLENKIYFDALNKNNFKIFKE